jgi:predicted nucleic acid-binding protein
MTEVCIDAGLAIKLVLQESDSARADQLFAKWKAEETRLIVPAFAPAEIDSIIRQRVARGEITEEQAETYFQAAVGLPIEFPVEPTLRLHAWKIARQFSFVHVYDAVYLALAELRGCQFWTADRRLFDQVKNDLNFVRHVADWSP